MRRLAFWMAVAVVFTLPWENVLGVPGLGTISRAMGLGAAAIWGLAVLGAGSVRRPSPPLLVALVFVVWNGFSVFWSVDVDVSIGRFLTFGQLFVLMFLLWDTVRTRHDYRIVMQAYVLGAWVTVITLIRHAILYGPEGYQVRYTVGDFQFDDIGLVFALGIPMAWYLATTPTHSPWGRVWQVLNIVHVPAAVVGIMFSGSRVALVAVAPSLLYILLTVIWLPRRARATALAGIAGLFVALVPTVPPETMQRIISTADDPSQGDLNGRTDLWAQAYLTFQQHPFTGVGTGAFREGTTWKVAHNVWLRFAAELGLVGLGLFLLMMLLLFVGAGRSTRALGTFCYTVLTVWIIGATFYNAEDKKQTWLVLTLVLLAGTFRTEPSTGSEQEPAPGRPTAPGSEPLLLSDPPPLS